MAESVVDQFLRGFQPKFEENALLVGLNGALADVELLPYLSSGQTLGAQPDNLHLTLRKFVGVGNGIAVRTEKRIYALFHLIGLHGLTDETVNTVKYLRHYLGRQHFARKQQHLHFRTIRFHNIEHIRCDAVGEEKIEHQQVDVVAMRLQIFNGLHHTFGFCHHLAVDTRITQRHLQPSTKNRVVIDNHYPDFMRVIHPTYALLTVKLTVVPCPS